MVEDCSPYPYFRFTCRDQAALGHSSGRYLYRDGALAFLVAWCLFHRFHQDLVQDIAPLSRQDETCCNSFLGLQQYRRFRLFASLFSCCLKKVLQIIWGNGREFHSIPFPSERCLLTSFICGPCGLRIESALFLLVLFTLMNWPIRCMWFRSYSMWRLACVSVRLFFTAYFTFKATEACCDSCLRRPVEVFVYPS